MDIDIEALQRFDGLLNNGFFAGHEGGDHYANNAIMGAESGHHFISEMMEYTRSFPLTHPEWPNETGPRMITKLLLRYGWDSRMNALQTIAPHRITIYPSKTFYPYFWKEKFTPECVTSETLAIHHWASSWTER